MIERPNDLKWEILHYNDFQEPLVVTALARLTNKTSTGVVPGNAHKVTSNTNQKQMENIEL